MLDLQLLEIETEKETNDFGRFIIEPLDQGFGHTLGNSLRRTLLGFLPGAAITQVKISGARHQFSTLSGMAQDVVEFVLSLKGVRLISTSDKPQKLTLDVKGPKEVKAKDIGKASGVAIVNGDMVIAHLADSKSKLSVQLVVEKGQGYSLASDRQSNEIGVIPIDANFSPVDKVNYFVEPTRVGRLTNFDKLTIEVMTDGTIKPSEALKQAAKILVDHFAVIHQPQTSTKKKKVEEKAAVITDDILNASLEELDLPVRLTNSLKTGKISTIGDFLARDRKEILKMKNMGPKSVALVEEKLKERGVERK